MLLCFYVNLRCCTTSFMDSLLGGMDLRPRERAAGATHVQISWISAWIPTEVTRTFSFDLPIWDSNSSSFSCRSFSSQREPTVVGSIKLYLTCCFYRYVEDPNKLIYTSHMSMISSELTKLRHIVTFYDNTHNRIMTFVFLYIICKVMFFSSCFAYRSSVDSQALIISLIYGVTVMRNMWLRQGIVFDRYERANLV